MRTSKGFGLLELMVVRVVAGLLATLAIPAYKQFVDRARTARAIGDIASIGLEIEKFRLVNDSFPPLDPWGRPYTYLNIAAAGPGKGAFRKDGDSKGPLNAKASRDDVVRANNGAFIGRAEDY